MNPSNVIVSERKEPKGDNTVKNNHRYMLNTHTHFLGLYIDVIKLLNCIRKLCKERNDEVRILGDDDLGPGEKVRWGG